MKLTLRRYGILLGLQFTFLIADLIFNTFKHLILKNNLQLSIFLFVTQDIFIVCEYLLFIFAVHSTCVFEVGVSTIILRNCKFFLFNILTYFLLSVAQHIYIVYNAISNPIETSSTLTALIFVHKIVSFTYYYSLKRTALTIADPRYYEENIDWISQQIGDK